MRVPKPVARSLCARLPSTDSQQSGLEVLFCRDRGAAVCKAWGVEEALSVLPRTTSEAQTLFVAIKRKLEFKRAVWQGIVRADRVRAAMGFLAQQPLYQAANVALDFERELLDNMPDGGVAGFEDGVQHSEHDMDGDEGALPMSRRVWCPCGTLHGAKQWENVGKWRGRHQSEL